MSNDGENRGVNIKPLCPTRWTVRTGAIDATIKDYAVVMDTMEEVNRTHDEHGLKAGGALATLRKFETLFGLKLRHLFGPAKEMSNTLQWKDTSIQEAASAGNLRIRFYQRQREDTKFDRFCDRVLDEAKQLKIDEPKLPWYKKVPARLDDGSQPHRYSTPRDYFCQQYLEACDILIRELEDRFEQEEPIKPVFMLESLLPKAANGDVCSKELLELEPLFYKDDLDVDPLGRQLLLLVYRCNQARNTIGQESHYSAYNLWNMQTPYKSTLSKAHEVATALSDNSPNICHG